MARNQTRPLSSAELRKDLDDFAALEQIATYNSPNPDYSLETLRKDKNAMQTKEAVSAQKKAEADAARDDEIAGQWKFHNGMKGARAAAKLQYGADSNEAQMVGLKKESEYKPRRRRSGSNGGNAPPNS